MGRVSHLEPAGDEPPVDPLAASAVQLQALNMGANGNPEPSAPSSNRTSGRLMAGRFTTSIRARACKSSIWPISTSRYCGRAEDCGGRRRALSAAHAPANGERALALLTYDTCRSAGATVVNVVSVRNGMPRSGPRLVLPGSPRESRLVGDILYVVTDNWRAFPYPASFVTVARDYWRRETTITSINLARPDAPLVGRPITLAGSADAVQATDNRLFVAMTGTEASSSDPSARTWLASGAHAIRIFNIADPSGTVRDAGHVLTAGVVTDKFKIHQSGDVLHVVSFDSAGAGRTMLETWSFPGRTGRERWGDYRLSAARTCMRHGSMAPGSTLSRFGRSIRSGLSI
jgi:hypothetical protein